MICIKKSPAILVLLIFLAGCARIETDDDGKDVPDFLKKALEDQVKKGLQEEAEKRLEESGKLIYGVFLSQGIMLSNNGGSFDARIKNNNKAGNFNIRIE